jgi:IS30 family transposase
MSYHHFTIEERCCLREFYNKGYSYRKIAELLGRNVSSISREIMRNKSFMNAKPAYYPHTAQKKYLLRRSYCHRGMFQDPAKIDYIKEKLLLTWSPEQIANTPCELKMPSTRTIYRWIYERYVDVNLKVLRRKGKSRGKKETRGKFNLGKTIRKRDKSVYKRQEFGHWEADTVVSGRGKSKACFATLAERKTRYYIAIKMPNRNADTMAKAIISALSELPDDAVKTITCDRGAEFANWQTIEKELNCSVYFADPYCAWQKGSN